MARKTTTKTDNLPAVAEKGGAVVSYEQILAERAAKAKAQTARLPSGGGGQGMSYRGGTMTWAGRDIGHTTDIIILGYLAERTYYDRPYSPDDRSPPTCYSYDGDGPHEKSADPQSSACNNCPHNEWGSANIGNGKACKEGARMIFIPADTEDFANVQPTTSRISTLNSKLLVDYVSLLDAKKSSFERVVTTKTCHPDSKSQYKLGFKAARPFAPSKAQMSAFLALLTRADEELSKPYPEPRDEGKGRKVPQQRQGAVRRSRQ